MIVVCDSTVLIGLAKIGKLDLLKELFSESAFLKKSFMKSWKREQANPGLRFCKAPAGLKPSRSKTEHRLAS